MEFDAPYRHDPDHPMNAPTPGAPARMIPVDLGNGKIEHMQESALVRSVGGSEDDNEIVEWVEYHLPGTDTLVHRSAHVHLKKPAVFGEGSAAAFG